MTGTQLLGVVGGGLIGAGVAHCAARAGHPVVLVDLDGEALAAARGRVLESVHLQRLLGGGGSSVRREELMSRIRFTTDPAPLAGSWLVVEAVTERRELKEEVFRRLDGLCPPETVFASTTSAIPITRLAAASGRPDRVLGLHFMNPVALKPQVEMVRGFHTSEETLETGRTFLAGLGKTAVLVADSPGFVTNRVLMMTLNEAIFLLHERVAGPVEIDQVFKGCFGHKMGPLETADMIGLDTVLQSLEVLQESFGDSKYRPCPLLRQMVDAGLLGRKSGQGFHTYRVP